MDDDPTDNPGRFWTIYLAIVSVILFVGWKQPLRYRFMTKRQIDAIEHPATPTPPPATPRPVIGGPAPTPNWLWDPNRKNPLERR